MKVWYQHTRPPAERKEELRYFEMLKENWKSVCRSDTRVVIKSPTRGLPEHSYFISGLPYTGFLRQVEMLEGVLQAEREGYDAVVIGCFGDPGLTVARHVLGIPVVGPLESSIMLGRLFGKIALICLPGLRKLVEDLLTPYGTALFAIANQPVRELSLSMKDLDEEALHPDRLIDNFLEVGRTAVRDGAEVIIPACAHTAPVLTFSGLKEVDDVPILDCVNAAIKIAEVFVDLKNFGICNSKKSIPEHVIKEIRKAYYHGSKSA
jgi:allantoin racemase